MQVGLCISVPGGHVTSAVPLAASPAADVDGPVGEPRHAPAVGLVLPPLAVVGAPVGPPEDPCRPDPKFVSSFGGLGMLYYLFLCPISLKRSAAKCS